MGGNERPGFVGRSLFLRIDRSFRERPGQTGHVHICMGEMNDLAFIISTCRTLCP